MDFVPAWLVPRVPGGAGGSPEAPVPWQEVPALPPFVLADASAPAARRTMVRLAWDDAALHVRFDCEDRDAWGTFAHRDDPLYLEECVEVFLAPGAADPASYFELEVSPLGVLFDAKVANPESRRETMRVDTSWDCPGLRWAAGRTRPADEVCQDWWAELAIPFAAVAGVAGVAAVAPGPAVAAVTDGGEPPRVWRANFYRIERPRDGEPEFSCWSPTRTSPPDFHKPARFGRLELTGGAAIR